MIYFYLFIILQVFIESFPVSSSGHIKLFSLVVDYCEVSLPYIFSTTWFFHLLHVPVVIITLLFFKNQWIPLVCHPWRYKKVITTCLCIVFIVDSVTAFLYIILSFCGVSWFPLGAGFAITGCVLYVDRFCRDSYSYQLSYYNYFLLAVSLGLVQGFALLPGVSRFATTYVCAHWFTRDAHKAFTLSWMVVFPLLIVGAVHGLMGVYVYGIIPELLHLHLYLVIIGSTIAAWYGLCLVYRMACAHTFYQWWLYMLVPFFIWVLLVV